MRLKFNRSLTRSLCLASILILGLPTNVRAQSLGLPLIVPEAVFANLARVTGATTQQRIMDRGSIIRIRLADNQDKLPPDTSVLLFRQGLRLRNGDRTLGVLAVPVGRGRTLQRISENEVVADPDEPGIAWVRLQSVRQEVSRGDSLMTERDAKNWEAGACDATSAATDTAADSANSQVIALASSDVLADPLSTSLDLVIISGGCAAGLREGRAVSLWRPPVTTYGRKLDQPVDARDNSSVSVIDDNPGILRTQIPGHRIGSGIVVAVYPEAAIVRLRVATQPIQIGDQARPTHIRNQP